VQQAPETEHSPRVIGATGALSIVVGSMLGIGIFLMPALVASHVGSLTGFFAVWLFGGAVALAGGSVYAALGSLFPRAGGDYVFLRESFGPSISFSASLLLFFGVFVGSIATTAVPLFEFQFAEIASHSGLNISADPIFAHLVWSPSWRSLGAISLIGVLTIINAIGTTLSSRVQVLLTVVPFAFLFLGALYAVFSGDLWSAPVSPAHATRADSMAGYVQAASAVYFAYSGWNAVAYVGGEIQDPKRNIPFSLIGGTLVITLLYLLMCAGFVSVLGIEGLRSTAEAGTAVSAALFGDGSRMLMAALIATALIGSLNGCVLAGARVAAAAAADGLAPRWLAKFDPKLGTPVRALVVQFFAASILVLSGRFEDLVTLTSLAMMLLGSLSVIGLFRLLRRPEQDRTGLVLIGFPWLPIAYLAASLIVVVSSLYQSMTNTEAGLSQRLLPMLGLLLFVGAWIGHALLERLRARAAAKG